MEQEIDAVDTQPPPLEVAPVAATEGPDIALLAREGKLSLNDLLAYVEQLRSQGHLQAACNLYGLWLQGTSDPRRHMVYFNYGALLQANGQPREAVAAYQSSLALAPGFAQSGINLGLTLEKLGQTDEALKAWGQIVNQRFLTDSASVEMQTTALNHIGRLQEQRHHYEQAEKALEDSLRLNPRQPGVIQHWVHIRQKACKWPVYTALPGVSLGAMVQATSPLAMLALSDDPVQQLLTAQSFVARTYTLKEEQLYDGRSYQHTKLRVGYVSADLREHAVGFLLGAFFRGHDTQRYELYAYDYTKEETTAVRQELKGFFHQVRSIHALTDRQAAELILQDEIDVLIDLHGLSSGARPGIFALHPAPKQGTYLGFIGTTGMPWFDFVLADKQVLPPELTVHFTERPLYLESTFIPQAAPSPSLPAVSRSELGLPDDAFVMGAFGNVYKVTPQIFLAWMNLLRRIPKSLVWLIDDNAETTANLRAEAAKAQIDPARLVFAARTDHVNFCARLSLADVYLDTYPYNCGSTSRDVINAGVPLVTLYGDTMVSRMGLSILTSVNCADLAVTSLVDYEDKVVELYLKRKKSGRAAHPYSALRASARIHTALEQLSDIAPPATKAASADVLRRKKPKSTAGPNASPAAAPKADTPPAVQLFQLSAVGSEGQGLAAPFRLLDKPQDEQPGWAGYGAIRHYLLNNTLEDNCFYGFFSGSFQAHTGLGHGDISEFVRQHGAQHDVLGFSPFWDLSSLFINPFVQAEAASPGFLHTAQAFCQSSGLELDLKRQVMHADNTIFLNYFVAKRRFWLHWLELGEKLFAAADDPGSALHAALNAPAKGMSQGSSQKVLLHERLVSLLLARGGFTSKCVDMFALKPSDTDLNAFYAEAVTANALKQRCVLSPGGPEMAQLEQLQQGIFQQG